MKSSGEFTIPWQYYRLSDTETLIDRLLDILAGISRIIRHCVLHDTSFYTMRSCEDNFKIPIAFTSKKKKIGRFQGLPQFKWTDLGGQDVIGQGTLEPFLSPSTQGERTEIRPRTLKQLLWRNCSGLHSISSMLSQKIRGKVVVRSQARQHS